MTSVYNTNDTVTVGWQEVDGAIDYELWYYDGQRPPTSEGTGGWVKFTGDVGLPDSAQHYSVVLFDGSHVDISGQSLYFRVRAIGAEPGNQSDWAYGTNDALVGAGIPLPEVEAEGGVMSMTVTWDHVGELADADAAKSAYELWYKNTLSSVWETSVGINYAVGPFEDGVTKVTVTVETSSFGEYQVLVRTLEGGKYSFWTFASASVANW